MKCILPWYHGGRSFLLTGAGVLSFFLAGFTGLQAQNINIPNKTGPMGLQVNTLTGNLYFSRTDLFIPARGISLDITFHYNSFNYDRNDGYGKGWSFAYHIRYRDEAAGAKTITWGDGREDQYLPDGSGGFTPPRGFFSTLAQYQPGKYRITETDGTSYFFDNSTHKRITRLEEPNGNFLSFTYTDTLLTGITNGSGQSISLAYTNGRLATITDALSAPTRTIRFTYNVAGDLVDVKNPLNHSHKYDYLVNGPMKSVTDRNNNKIDIVYYNNFSVSELIGCNKRLSFSYDTSTPATVVTDYLTTGSNQVTTYQFRKQEGKTWLSGLSGNCCGFNMKFEFDAAGNKIRETDAKGQVTTFTYDTRGNLLTLTDPLNQTVTYTYTPLLNRVASYTDEKGFTTTMTYDARGNLTQLTEPGNLVYTAVYAANGDILSSTDPKGNTFTYNYDAYGNPVNVTGPNGYSAQLQFNARGDLLSVTNARGHRTDLETDILGRLKKITDPLSQTIQFSYDPEDNAVAVQNQNNEPMSMAYDASNRLVEITDVAGGKTMFTYDAMDNLRSIRNTLGHTMLLEYDNRNRLKKITDPEGNALSADFDPNGNMSSVQLPNGQVYNYQYDALNRLVSASDATGQQVALQYDKNSNVTRITNGTGASYTAAYDSLNRVIQLTDPLSHTILLGYDKNSRVVSLTDRNGFTSTYTYDSLNRVKTATDNNGHTVTISYDPLGNMTAVTDQNNNVTSYTYDSLNRVKRTTYPDGRFTENTYDSKSNIIARRITDGTTLNFTYDSLNRVVSKTLPDGQVFTYTYDALGRLLTATNQAGTVTFTYDALNRVTSETFGGRTVGYTYNISGRTRTVVYPDSTLVTYSYDTRNRLTAIAKNNTVLVSYQYNNANQLIAKTMANGITTSYQYDFANRLSSLSTSGGAIQNSQFTYNNERQKTAINRLNDPTRSEQFSYDDGRRLTHYKRGAIGGTPVTQNSYTYDPLGNRTSANLNGINTTYTTNNLNQLVNSNNGTQNINFTYDNNGNLTYDGQFYKFYDAEKRLWKDSSSPAHVITYQYDALNRRTRKTVNGTSRQYTFSGITPIEERDPAGNTLLNRTFFAGWLNPVVNEKDNAPYFYHLNELNSVEAVTDQQGRLVEKYAYDVYGKMSRFDSLNNPLIGSPSGNRFGFTGQEYDSATGRYKFFFREYNPETGLFSQRDLIGYTDGMGLYQYVHNDPANGVDVLGLEDCDPPTQTPSGLFPNNPLDWSLYAIGNLGNIPNVTALTNPKFWGNHPGLNILFAPVAAKATYDSYQTLENWNTNTYGKNVDASIGLVSNGLNTVVGGASGTMVVSGTLAEMAFGGQSLTAAFATASTDAAGLLTVGGTITGAGAVVATAGGLAIFGTINELTRLGTGKTIAENGEGWDIPVYTKSVEWLNSNPTDRYGLEYISWEQQNFRSESGKAFVLNPKWKKIRDEIESGEWFKKKPRYRPNPQCPQNNGGGTQKPASVIAAQITDLVEVLTSFDPNEIIGPDGVPDKSWVSINDRLPYTVNYENDTSASAPAKYVKIVVPVDAKMDPASFQLGSFGFNSLTFTMPPATASNYQRLDCRDSLGLLVDVIAGYDVVNNQFFWELQSLDPVTLLPPADPLKGFLLLQDSSNRTYGHGFVNFSIKPVSSAMTLDSILARADIIFDSNDTIPTNVEKNTIDALPPVSNLAALPGNSTNPLTLSWAGTDDVNGCGLHYYTLYVSSDGINFSILKDRLQRTDTTLSLAPNTRYYFFVLATDSVGNRETLRAGAIRNTFIGTALPVTWLYFRGVNRNRDNVLDWATANEQNTRSFKVERSLDGTRFSEIGSVAAAGNSSSTTTYTYTDRNIDRLNSSVMFYRLRQVDLDDNFRYSPVIRLTYKETVTRHSIVFPNPASQQITIAVGDKKLIGTTASVFDMNGRLLDQFTISGESQTYNISRYLNGLYLIRLENQETLRITKQ